MHATCYWGEEKEEMNSTTAEGLLLVRPAEMRESLYRST